MTKTFPLAAVCCFVLAAALRADAPPAEPPVDPAVAKLIEQLGDDDYRVRDEASRALKAAGPKVLPALHQALNNPDAEVHRRVYELLPVLESAALLAPKRVTFKTTDKPIKDAFDELIRQTGYHVEYNVNDPNKLYSFDFKDVSFWEALDRISKSSGLVIQQGYGDDHVRLYPQDGASPYVHYAGAFRFMATGFSQYRNIDFGQANNPAKTEPRTDSLTLMFAVFVEPKMAILGVGEAHIDAAYDNEKHSLLVPVNPNEFLNNPFGGRRWTAGKYGNGNRMYTMQTQVNLQRPSERTTSVKVIRGTIPATLLVDQKETVVTDKLAEAKGTKIEVGTTQFVIESVTEMPGKQYQIKMALTEDLKDDPNDFSWVNSLFQRIEVQDAKGNPMQVFQSNWMNQTTSHVEMQMTYGSTNGKPEPPAKLIYRTWITRQENIPFEFKDLPLP